MGNKIHRNNLNILAAVFCYSLAASQLNFVLTMIVTSQHHIEDQNNLQLLLYAERVGRKNTILLGKERENVRMVK